MKILKYFFLALLSIVFISFCVVNRKSVTVSFFPAPYSFDVPIFLLALVCVGVGVVITGILMNIKFVKTFCALKKCEKKIQAMENENKALRFEREQPLLAINKQS